MELYYYTNVETMSYILQNANIYATNLGYMNDAEEYANGVRELREIFNERRKKELITEEMLCRVLEKEITSYSISFSEARDLLSQWSMYAGESGVSLKMCFSGMEKYRAYPESDGSKAKEREDLPDTEEKLSIQKVYYCTKTAMDENEYRKIADEIWDEATKRQKYAIQDEEKTEIADIDDEYPTLWKRMAPFVKRAEFKAEAEYRLVFNMAEWEKVFRIDYRNSRNVLKPFLDIECAGGWPIHEIVVGPGFNQNVVFQSILHFLNHARIKVPKLSGPHYRERCEEYFRLCGDMPEEHKKIWDKYKSCFEDNMINHYSLFMDIRSYMVKMTEEKSGFQEQLLRRELTRTGIILSRSRIPYIF